jgi:hypothetical protein
MKVHGTGRTVHHALETDFLLLRLLGPLLSLEPHTRSRPLTGKPHYILEDLIFPMLDRNASPAFLPYARASIGNWITHLAVGYW